MAKRQSNILDSAGSERRPLPQWWTVDEESRHTAIADTLTFLLNEDSTRRARFLRLAGRYANRPIVGLAHDSYNQSDLKETDVKIRMNVSRTITDAVQAKIAKNKPKPTVLTEGGDFSLRQKARRLDQYIWGQFYKNKVYELGPMCFRDAEVWGVGVAKIIGASVNDKLGRVHIERVFPWELLVDPLEAMYGNPRSLFHTKLVDRRVLANAYQKASKTAREAIARCPVAPIEGGPGRATYADQLLVTEAWHLPSGEDAGDGVHSIAIETGLLDSDEWTDPDYPLVMLHWTKPLIGYFGEGLIEEIEDIQDEIHELVGKIQQAFWHNANPKILIPTGGKITKAKINNDARGCEIEYSGGEPPQWIAPSTVAPEVFNHFERLYSLAFEIPGVSQLSAQSKKPSGLDSQVALQEFNDIESERFVIRGQAYEQFFLDLATQIVAASKRLNEQGLDVEVRAENRKRRRTFIERIKWSEVDLQRDAFLLKMFPTSSLPQSPAGRLAAVEQLAKSGLIDPMDAKHLLDYPDLESVVSRETAPYEIVLDQIERMIDEGKPTLPSPYQDVTLALRVTQLALLRAQMDEVPEERLELMREYITACEDHVLKEQSTQAAQAPAMPGAPAPPMDPAAAAMPPQGMPMPMEAAA